MMNKMIVSNLAHRPLRSAISIVAIALEVTLILLIVGFSIGMLNDSRSRQAGIGADVIVLPPSSSILVGITGAPMPIKIANILAKLPHVAIVSPVLLQIQIAGNAPETIYGIDLGTYNAMRPFTYLKGAPFQQANDALVDDVYASARHARVGEAIQALNHTFRVAGIVEHGKGARLFLPLSTLQELNGAQEKASAFYVKTDNPANAETVVNEIEAVPGMSVYVVRSMRDYLSMMTPDHVPSLSTFIRIVIGISVAIGFIAIFQAMYTAVMERTREIGILKSLGASKFYIVNVILRETTLLAVGGILLGILVSFAASAGIHKRIATLPVEINLKWIVNATIIAIVGALAGAIYPAFKAAQKDPIDALAYE